MADLRGSSVALTLDIDWAPDWAIDLSAEILREHEVRATWLVTHSSPAVDRLREEPDLFELGIHPNFLPNSTQGSSPEEVLEHCMELVPDAVTMRAHALVQSSPILHTVASETPIATDLSLFLPYMPGIQPVLYAWEGSSIVRLPYFWEDDHEMQLDEPKWDASGITGAEPGIKVINFHPIHVYLNSASMDAYKGLGPLDRCTEADAAAVVESGAGPRTLLEDLAAALAGESSWRIRDFAERFPALWPLRADPLGG